MRPSKKKNYQIQDCSQISGVFKFLAHPRRVQLLVFLRREGELSVMELVEKTKMSQSQVSQTMQKLKLSGMVEAERHGNSIHYRIKCVQLKELLKQIEVIYPLF